MRSALRSWGSRVVLAAGLGLPAALGAQSLPAYAPLNPVAAARSGLGTRSWIAPGRKWHFSLLLDYGNQIEYAVLEDRSYLLDAEVLRLGLGVVRNLGAGGFILAESSLNGAYNGFLDGFLDWYHDLTGLRVSAREIRPRNAFGYELHLPGDRNHVYRATSGFLGDLRVGAGLRHSRHWQSTLSFTFPTGNSPAGFRKGTVSAGATTLLRSEFAERFVYEGTLGVGYTPSHGELSDLQRTTFLLLSQGIRGRVSGVLHAYLNVIYHSPYYRDTGIQALDDRELTIDLGGMLRFRRGPEWIFGLTEDLAPSGPAIDVAFRIGARW